jgi:hypothetical protein
MLAFEEISTFIHDFVIMSRDLFQVLCGGISYAQDVTVLSAWLDHQSLVRVKRVHRLKERLSLRVGNVLTHIPYTLHHNCVHIFGMKDPGKHNKIDLFSILRLCCQYKITLFWPQCHRKLVFQGTEICWVPTGGRQNVTNNESVMQLTELEVTNDTYIFILI